MKNLTQVVVLQIHDFSRLSVENLEYFLNEMYADEIEDNSFKRERRGSDNYKSSSVALREVKHNLPEICIEINVDKLTFLHSRFGPKIFEVCGITSPYHKFITRLSFIAMVLPSLFTSKVFQKSMSQMCQVREISVNISKFVASDQLLNLQNCGRLQVLNLDLGVKPEDHERLFQYVLWQYFTQRQYTNLQLPTEFAYDEESNDIEDEDCNYQGSDDSDGSSGGRFAVGPPTLPTQAQRRVDADDLDNEYVVADNLSSGSDEEGINVEDDDEHLMDTRDLRV